MKYKSKQACQDAIIRLERTEEAIPMPYYTDYPNEDGSYAILYWYIYYV